MRAVIADDEPVARQILRELIEETGGVEVLAEVSTGREAVECLARCDPDVIFLDIQMPGLDGFAVARGLRAGHRPAVIFVTAFDGHAVDAFQVGAVDYLLKPVRRERLAAAIERVRQRLPAPQPRPASSVRRVTGRSGPDYHLIDIKDVIAFQAASDTVYILTASGRYTSEQTLKALEDKLPAEQFRRIHRGTIINTDHIRRISPLSSKRWLLKMSNGLETIVSRRLAGTIRQNTGW